MKPAFLFKNFKSDSAGNFSLMAALLIPVLLFTAGLAVDFGAGMNAKSQLQAASDAASLAVSTAYTNGETDNTKLTEIANRYFKTNAAKAGIDTSSLTFSMAISGTAPKIVTMDVSAKMKLMMSGIYGKDTWDIAAKTTSTVGTKTFYQVGFLLDNSGSMGIGATTADIAKLVAKINCQFACHNPAQGNHSVSIAAQNGIKLKFDYVRSSLNIFVDKLKPAANANPNYYKMGIFTYGTAFKTYQPFTTNMNDFDTKAASVQLEEMLPFAWPTHNGFTNVETALTQMKPLITDIGDGTTASKRKTYLIIITDGVQDLVVPSNHPYKTHRVYSANYGAYCTSIKNEGINIITIQTNYPQMADGTYNAYIKPLKPTIEATLRGCASTADGYIHADDGPAIEDAINKAFSTIFGDVRINS